MTKFQLAVIGFFVIFIVVGVAVFATYKGRNSGGNQLPPITIWGTFPQQAFDHYIAEVNLKLTSPISVTYVEKNRGTFSQEFIAALARGTGPDGILIPADMILPHMDKLTPIPYSALSERQFKDTYIQEGEIYLGQSGSYALPFVVDPLVMYWNRDIFSAAGLPSYPKYWDEFDGIVKKVNSRDAAGNIRRSAIASGDFSNIVNAREFLASLVMQVGNNITYGSGNVVQSALRTEPSAAPALEFFTQFADPNSKNYSWNRAMQDSKTAFLAGTLGTYFGFASELSDIRLKNPNLNFDVAAFPQFRLGGRKTVYAKMYGLSIVRASQKQNGSYQIFSILTNPTVMQNLSSAMYLPSVRRDVIGAGSADPYITVFNAQALIGRTWLDADSNVSFGIFGNMINSITSGAKTVKEALSDASDQYDVALKQAIQ